MHFTRGGTVERWAKWSFCPHAFAHVLWLRGVILSVFWIAACRALYSNSVLRLVLCLFWFDVIFHWVEPDDSHHLIILQLPCCLCVMSTPPGVGLSFTENERGARSLWRRSPGHESRWKIMQRAHCLVRTDGKQALTSKRKCWRGKSDTVSRPVLLLVYW